MKLYISGPMTGYQEWNFPAFHAAHDQLEAAGHDVVNPAAKPAGEMSWADYLKMDLIDICSGVEGIALLTGWEMSKGARLEVTVAWALDLPTRPLKDWLT